MNKNVGMLLLHSTSWNLWPEAILKSVKHTKLMLLPYLFNLLFIFDALMTKKRFMLVRNKIKYIFPSNIYILTNDITKCP